MLGLPVIQDISDLSKLTHISKYTIYQLSKHSDKYYRIYSIPKKSGGQRIICQPAKKLKGLQAWLLVNILNKTKTSESCKGFEKGSSILDNVKPHRGSNTVLSIDIEDYFPSINSKQVYNIFYTIGYNKLMATVFTNICTCNGFLPQGSPCSPRLANLVSWMLDVRIQGYVGRRGINYTRYADDMTFSGLKPKTVTNIIPVVKSILLDEGFKINSSKTRIAGAARAKRITGLILSDNSCGIGKQEYKKLRSKIYHLALDKENKNTKLLNHVNGWLSYLNSVDKKRLEQVFIYIKKLENKFPNRQMSKFDPIIKKDNYIILNIENNQKKEK